jgi:hypothetical protein
MATVFPVQVTKFLENRFALREWEIFLENKGYETSVREVHKKYKGRNIVFYALYRNLSAKERKELDSGMFKIRDSFLTRDRLFERTSTNA